MKYYYNFLKSAFIYYEDVEDEPYFYASTTTGMVVLLHLLLILDLISIFMNRVISLDLPYQFILLVLFASFNYYLLKKHVMIESVELSEKN